jgi:Flp pilus assembly protein TadD
MAKSRREQLEDLLRADPDDPFLQYGLAMEDVSAGDDGEAARRLQELLRTTPTYVAAYMQAGQALLRLGREDEARATWRSGVEAARAAKDLHAAGEMEGFLAALE